MFRVCCDGDKTLEFLTYNEFSNYRIRAARDGYKPYYSHSVRLRGNTYIYYYQLRTIGEPKK